MPGVIDVFTSTLASSVRGWSGILSSTTSKKPEKLLRLYDIENSPYCRLVREALTELNLDAIILPCPKNGKRFRPEVIALGGKAKFPYLVDESQDVSMYESLDIVRFLYRSYGTGKLPIKWQMGSLQTLTSAVASGFRLPQGSSAIAARSPEQMLELYSFEASPFARPVRELLCRLEIPYILRSCGRSEISEWLPPPLRERFGIKPESQLQNRRALLSLEGKMGIPFLYDPNTDTGMFESAEIIDYLMAEYALER
ncbi:MAG: glutathione S-transferase [Gammaproteobacteria bacterium]|nr:glutathione S-transferase [Gammaproteobacteria bacterium]